jgi:hypothetical protein
MVRDTCLGKELVTLGRRVADHTSNSFRDYVYLPLVTTALTEP